jgi:hypothetical protein
MSATVSTPDLRRHQRHDTRLMPNLEVLPDNPVSFPD